MVFSEGFIFGLNVVYETGVHKRGLRKRVFQSLRKTVCTWFTKLVLQSLRKKVQTWFQKWSVCGSHNRGAWAWFT